MATAVWIGAVIVAAIRNVHALNPDGVAYIRIGEYFAGGQRHLAISGYWSPLLSWIIALLLRMGLTPLTAARVSMAISALPFVAGAAAVVSRFDLREWQREAGIALVALASVSWSVEYITPDLLAAGLICAATSLLMTRPRFSSATGAGLLFGLAYLAKAVALPLAIIVTIVLSILRWRRKDGSLRSALTTLLVTLLVALPWIAVLTRKYGHLTFSTTVSINHAIAGPPDIDRGHPFVTTIHRPEPGRITSWEDPSAMAYRDWSPFASGDALRYQIGLLLRNLWAFAAILDQFGGAAAILALIFLALIAHERALAPVPDSRRNEHQTVPILWALVVPAALVALYAPLHIEPENFRFFYALLPFLYPLGMRGIDNLSGAAVRRSLRLAAHAIVLTLFFWPPLARAGRALRGFSNPASEVAFRAASVLRAAGVVGPVVGGATRSNGLPGLYLAFLLDQPWYGDLRQPHAAAYEQSGARIAVSSRWSAAATELQARHGFGDLDPIVFPKRAPRAGEMIRIFDLARGGTSSSAPPPHQ